MITKPDITPPSESPAAQAAPSAKTIKKQLEHVQRVTADPAATRALIRLSKARAAQETGAHIKRITADDQDINDLIDRGTKARWERGEIVRDDRPDIADLSPYKSTVRGYRRRDGLRSALSENVITNEQFIMGEQLRGDIEMSYGALDRGDFGMPRSTTNHDPAQIQIDAIDRVRRVKQFISPQNRAVIEWVIEKAEPLKLFAQIAKMRYTNACKIVHQQLRDGLDEISDFYNGQRKNN